MGATSLKCPFLRKVKLSEKTITKKKNMKEKKNRHLKSLVFTVV